ncbi:MAG: hypothetical protein NZ866_03085, partial [Patescibacteria group bacterium]|nr:hypothetical protein [Patescibacteria group bacterium]
NFQSLWYLNPNNKLRIPAWEFYGFTTNFDIVNLNEGDVLTINIDQVGLFLPGGDITVELLMLLKP